MAAAGTSPNTLEPGQPRPAGTYAEAMERIAALQAQDGPDVREDSRTRLWSQGQKSERALVYFHGYTNSPAQFRLLGEQFSQRGYNVFVPRLPHHGLQDPLTTAQSLLTAEELVALTEESVNIARGLGDQVIISGLSCGGVMAAWAAQFRADVDLAVGLAPAAGLPVVPYAVSTFYRKTIPHLPNFYIWWDPRVKEKIDGPPHAYPRFSTHGLAQVFRMGRKVIDTAKTTPAAARRLGVITSAFDTAINLPTVHRLEHYWQAHGADLRTYEFPKEQKVWHDMIDPQFPKQQIDATYPVVMQMITG